MIIALKRIVFLTILVILWEAVYRLGVWPSFMFPSPIDVFSSTINGLIDGTYSIAFMHSIRRLIIGFSIAIGLGLLIGGLISLSKTLDETLGMLIISLQSIPSVVWLPLAMLWFSMGEASIIFVVVIGGLFNMVINTVSGIKGIDPLLIKAGKNMGYKGFSLFRKIIIPACVPNLITGARLAWAFCWRALMASEVLGTGRGLGQILMWGRDMGNMKTVMSIMLIIALTGMLTDNLLFRGLEKKVYLRWGLISA